LLAFVGFGIRLGAPTGLQAAVQDAGSAKTVGIKNSSYFKTALFLALRAACLALDAGVLDWSLLAFYS
jgi:hypothetical protein